MLAFLLVYGMVAMGALRAELAGCSKRRRLLVSGSCLLAVSGLAAAYLAGVIHAQAPMLITFAVLLLLGLLRVRQAAPAAV